MNKNHIIFGFDVGIASIGWAVIKSGELDDCGVRIFTKAENPKNGASLALPRRLARGTRRRLARRNGRLNSIKQLICKEFGLKYEDFIAECGELPKAFYGKITNPYELREIALEKPLSPNELARVILHIAKHRGYGNKHARNIGKDDAENKEKGKILSAIKINEEKIKDLKCATAGVYLNWVLKEKRKVRNSDGNYSQTIPQELNKEELELIFKKQAEFGVKFSENFAKKVVEIAFFQRPLKSFDEMVGECVFLEGEKRAAKNTPSAIKFIALSRIVNILENISKRTGEYYNKKDIIDEILNIVLHKGSISFSALRKILNLPESIKFNDSKLDYSKDTDKNGKSKNIETANFIEFKNLKKFNEILGNDNFNQDELDKIATEMTLIKDKEILQEKLKSFSLDNEQIEKLSDIDFSGFVNLSLKALKKILPFMQNGDRYDEAVRKSEMQEHKKSIIKSDELLPLNKYEEIKNPVVARACGEYRKVLNALIKKHGKPHKINIELTREVGKNWQSRQKYIKEQNENLARKKEAEDLCRNLGIKISSEKNDKNILKARLFIEQGEICVYSGRKISINDLKDDSALEIDHIYPYSRGFDDSYMNKVLVFKSENQNKKNQTPFEAFGNDSEKWNNICVLAKKLPKQKFKRIINEAFKDKESGFLSRNIIDTGYIASLIKNWTENSLEFLPLDSDDLGINSTQKGGRKHVEVISGQLTSAIRHIWWRDENEQGSILGEKNRDNHLHHAVDAIIIAFMNAKIIKAFSDYKKNFEYTKSKYISKQISKEEYEKVRNKFEAPCKKEKILEAINKIFVSRPPRKSTSGALHKETFYKKEEFFKDYGGEKGVEMALKLGKIREVNGSVVENGEMVRVDIFKDKKNKFYGVPIYTIDFARRIMPNKAAVSGKDKAGIIKDWIEMNDNYEFCFSLYKDDLIRVQKKDMNEAVLCYYDSFNTSSVSISAKKT